MKVKDFIEEVKKQDADNIDEFIKSHIVKDYIPYELKITDCQRIINATMYEEIDEVKTFKSNKPMRCMFLMITIIQRYTDIEIDDTLFAFNQLCQYKLTDLFISQLSNEYYDYEAVLNMMVDDVLTNERNILSILDMIIKYVSKLEDYHD